MKKVLLIVPVLILIALIIFLFNGKETYPKPLSAKDIDGLDSSEIIKDMQNGYETIDLKANPFGYVEINGWENQALIKKVSAIVEWKTPKKLGAGNNYIGYSFDGKNYNETGPFKESENVTRTIIEVPVDASSNLNNLSVRFRGQDMDFGPDAIAEVSIRLKVTSSWI